jgi:hypothetical protein
MDPQITETSPAKKDITMNCFLGTCKHALCSALDASGERAVRQLTLENLRSLAWRSSSHAWPPLTEAPCRRRGRRPVATSEAPPQSRGIFRLPETKRDAGAEVLEETASPAI